MFAQCNGRSMRLIIVCCPVDTNSQAVFLFSSEHKLGIVIMLLYNIRLYFLKNITAKQKIPSTTHNIEILEQILCKKYYIKRDEQLRSNRKDISPIVRLSIATSLRISKS